VIRLVRAELLRVRSRRIFWWIVALAFVIVCVVGIVTFATHSTGGTPPLGVRCDPNGFCSQVYGDKSFHFTSIRPLPSSSFDSTGGGVVFSVGMWTAIMTFVLGASLIGAEWKAGTVGALLVFEPRRLRVFVSKLLVYMVVGAVLAILFTSLQVATVAPAAAWRGTFSGADVHWWRHLGQGVLLNALVAAGAAATGFGLANIARATAFAPASLFVFTAFVETIGGQIVHSYRPYRLTNAVFVLLQGGTRNVGDTRVTIPTAVTTGVIHVGVVLAASLLLFLRRDVSGPS
jgi:ABC-type transport system involved in multi-copper enzyme maturation permease subunit